MVSGDQFATGPKPHRLCDWFQYDHATMGQHEFEIYADKALQLRLEAATSRLAKEFDGIFDRDTIHAMVEESAQALSPNGVTP